MYAWQVLYVHHGLRSSDPFIRWCTWNVKWFTNKQKYQHRRRRTVNGFNPCMVLTSKNPRRLQYKKRYSILYRYRERGFEVFRCLFMWRGVKAVVPWARGGLPAGGGQFQEEARQTNARKEGCLWAQGEQVQSPNISNLIRAPLVFIVGSRNLNFSILSMNN